MLSSLNQRSDTHNSCEDTVWVEEEDGVIFGGIFDGCSTGKNSHWASQTLAYLFRRRYTKGWMLTNSMLGLVLSDMATIARSAGLIEDHFLSTAVLFEYDKKIKELNLRIFGDGVYFINDVEYIVDQGNTPDYLGYRLFSSTQERLDYFSKYPIITYADVNRFIICSDGIQAIHENQFEPSDLDPRVLLLNYPSSENYLQRMWNILKRKRFSLSDDLSIVSYAAT